MPGLRPRLQVKPGGIMTGLPKGLSASCCVHRPQDNNLRDRVLRASSWKRRSKDAQRLEHHCTILKAGSCHHILFLSLIRSSDYLARLTGGKRAPVTPGGEEEALPLEWADLLRPGVPRDALSGCYIAIRVSSTITETMHWPLSTTFRGETRHYLTSKAVDRTSWTYKRLLTRQQTRFDDRERQLQAETRHQPAKTMPLKWNRLPAVCSCMKIRRTRVWAWVLLFCGPLFVTNLVCHLDLVCLDDCEEQPRVPRVHLFGA